ncbi:MAG: hypothetical protein HY791_14280 [Deltaproteobacteria bacterium]|nr:hypothetical protein [Deltaproteobacteria bacterium]
MVRSALMISVLGLAACATTTPGSRPHDMSTAQHDQEAAIHANTAEQHAAQFDANAKAIQERCRPRAIGAGVDRAIYPDICWRSVTNPTETHRREAAEHRRHAADHRSGSAALREAEARACVGIDPDDRDTSPFDHVEDIARVEALVERNGIPGKTGSQRALGAVITFRAVPGLTAEWLQRVVDCHLARNASLGHVVPEMPSCPLVPNGVRARVSSAGDGFAVEVRSDDPTTAGEILSRAEKLLRPPLSGG